MNELIKEFKKGKKVTENVSDNERENEQGDNTPDVPALLHNR